MFSTGQYSYELSNLRSRINSMKDTVEKMNKKRNTIDGGNSSKINKYFDDEEAFKVNNCFEKYAKIIQHYNKKKKKRKIYNYEQKITLNQPLVKNLQNFFSKKTEDRSIRNKNILVENPNYDSHNEEENIEKLNFKSTHNSESFKPQSKSLTKSNASIKKSDEVVYLKSVNHQKTKLSNNLNKYSFKQQSKIISTDSRKSEKKKNTNQSKILNCNIKQNPVVFCIEEEVSNVCEGSNNKLSLIEFETNETSNLSAKSDLDIYSFKDNNSNISENILDFDCTDKTQNNETEISNEIEETIIPVWDFTKEPVDFSVPRLHISETLEMSEEARVSLKSEGISMRVGRWTEEEKAILKRNFENFTHQFKIRDPCLLLGIRRYVSYHKQENINIRKFLKAKHFYVRLGKDINNRSLQNIYKKARRMFDPFNKRIFEQENISLVLKLHNKYGNRWNLISKKSGIPQNRCHKIFQKYRKPVKTGKWSDEEVNNLLSAIKHVTGIVDLSSTSKNLRGLPFDKIAELVPTRNSRQCCDEWYYNQVTRLNAASCQKWNEQHTLKLLHLLRNNFFVENELDIDWVEIYPHFENVVPTTGLLKRNWQNLKRCVPPELKMKYYGLLKFLDARYNNKRTVA